MTQTSNSAIDPTGKLPPSTRDILAAHFAAATIIADKGKTSYSNPGASVGRKAYEFADRMLAERVLVDQEKGS